MYLPYYCWHFLYEKIKPLYITKYLTECVVLKNLNSNDDDTTCHPAFPNIFSFSLGFYLFFSCKFIPQSEVAMHSLNFVISSFHSSKWGCWASFKLYDKFRALTISRWYQNPHNKMQFLAWIERVEIKLLWRIDDDGGIDSNGLKCWENIKNLYIISSVWLKM